MREVIHDFAQWLAKKSYTPPKMQYYSHVDGMERWAPPKPMSRWVPEWYKKLPKRHIEEHQMMSSIPELQKGAPIGIHPDFGTSGQTIKTCPGMQDIMTTGFMLPFWSNAIITTTQDGNQALTHTATHMSEALGAVPG